MNLSDLIETLFVETGHPDTGADRPDYLYQKYKNALNTVNAEVAGLCNRLECLTRETTLAIVSGTQDYLIDDWCRFPSSEYTEDQYAHKVRLRNRNNADQDGSRNTVLVPYVLGPYMAVPTARTATPAYSGIAGATTGVTAVEGALTATFGAAVVMSQSMVGRMLKFNGEDGDYKILTVVGQVATLDRAICSRVSGLGTTHVGAGYAAATCRWEIGPAGRYQLRFLPSPNAANSLKLRYIAVPRKLLNTTDSPELPDDMHDLLWKGALRLLGASKKDDVMYQQYSAEYASAIARLKQVDEQDQSDSSDGPRTEMLGDDLPIGIVPGTYSRYGGGRYGF